MLNPSIKYKINQQEIRIKLMERNFKTILPFARKY